MHALTTPRAEPYVWVSWITKLLAGESCCVWSAWLRAHYQTAKATSTTNELDLGTWQVEHTALIRKAIAEYEDKGFTVFVENQNLFNLKGKLGTLSGKPDVVAVRGTEGWIIDTKTGTAKISDRIQVMLYMWALPLVNPLFENVMLRGKVAYKCTYGIITPDEVDVDFVERVGELMRVVCGESEPHKAPSYRECQYCPITPEDCADRADKERTLVGTTDEF